MTAIPTATAIAIGIRRMIAPSAMSANGSPTPQPAKQVTRPSGINPATQAIHSVCRRSTPVERRSRKRIAIAPAKRLPRMPIQSGIQIQPSQLG